MLFDLLEYLPDDIIEIIWTNLNPFNKLFLNKENYLKFNYLIDKHIDNYESYVRDIIRKDYAYSFNYILQRRYNYWLQMHNYKYNQVLYRDYFHFLLYYSCSNNASKCNNIIKLQLNLSRLKKDCYKNSRIKYNKWNN